MKGKTRITINRETVKDLLEAHVRYTLVGDYELAEFTIHRTGSIELVVLHKQEPVLPLGKEGDI